MKPPVAVIHCEHRSGPPGPPAIGPGLLVHELERRGHPVFRWHASVIHLEGLAAEARDAGCRLVVLDAATPAPAISQFRARLGSIPIVLVGDSAAQSLLPSGASFAIVGATREAVAELAEVLGRVAPQSLPSAEELRQVPNLLYRVDAVATRDDSAALRPDAATVQDDPTGTRADAAATAPPSPCIEASDVVVQWNADSELFPYAPPLHWNYRGPAGRDPAIDRARWPVIGGLGCVHPPFLEEASASPPLAYEFSDRARTLCATAAPTDPACPFGLCPRDETSRARALARALEQTGYLWEQGIRSFRLVGVESIDLAKAWLDALSERSIRPEEVVLSPSVHELRRGEARLLQALAEQAHTRFVLTGVTFWFNALFERSGQPPSWESRHTGRLLTRLAKERPRSLDGLRGHSLVLLDPETTLQQLLDALQAIEEDAPFLKRAIDGNATLPSFRPESRIGRYLEREGLAGGPAAGTSDAPWRFRDPELALLAELAERGRAPLLESIGRLRVEPEGREALVAEGGFRWFRELARFLIESRGSSKRAEDGWGRVLAAVLRELERDRTGST